MANFGERGRDSSDDLKFAAYEAAQLKISENQEKLSKKVAPVRSGRKNLEGANEEASATLEKFKGSKKEISKIKENFFDVVEDSDVRDFVVGLVDKKKKENSKGEDEAAEPKKEYKNEKERKKAENELLFKEYMENVGVEDDKSGLVEKYGKADERYKSLSKELRSGVKGRKKAKEELFGALKENNPEQEYGTYKELKEEAEKQTDFSNPESIEGKEIKNYVDGLVEKFKESKSSEGSRLSKMTEYLFKENRGLDDNSKFFSEDDYKALQKYGKRYAKDAEYYFLEGIKEAGIEAIKKMQEGEKEKRKEDGKKENPAYEENMYKAREGDLIGAIDRTWERLSKKENEESRKMEQILAMKKNMEKMEKVTPEIEKSFSDFDKATGFIARKDKETGKDTENGIRTNKYAGSIRSFENRQDHMVVEFNDGLDGTIEQKYLNFEYPDSRAPNGKAHHGFLGLDGIINNLDRLDKDLEKEREALEECEKAKKDYDKKSWFAKIGKAEVEKSVRRSLRDQTEKVKNMVEAQQILTGTKNFMENIAKLQKDNGFEMVTKVIPFDKEKKGFGFEDKMKESMKKRLGPE